MKIKNVSQCRYVIPDPALPGYRVVHPGQLIEVNDKSHKTIKGLLANYPNDFVSLGEDAPAKKAKASE